jgi:CheY-like chemotaxis protein
MKNILIIGIDALSGETLSRALGEYDDFFKVLIAENDDKALEICTRIRPDLVIVDLSQPDNKSLELLHHIKKSFPELPGIAIISSSNPMSDLKIEYPGITEYLNKPVDTRLLTDTVMKILEINRIGQIQDISLPSFLQMVEMEAKTCYLRVRQNRMVGYLYFKKGELIAARTGIRKNEEAAYEIIGWENANIEIFTSEQDRKKTIDSPLMNILIETLKRKDEKTSQKTKGQKTDKRKSELCLTKSTSQILHFGLEMGIRLHVKPENLAVTSKSTFIGMKPEEYLIIATPRSFDKFLEKPALEKQIIVKYLCNGIIFAFKSKILQSLPAPFDLLFLQYPNQVEQRYIRSLKRIKCFIPAKATCNDEETIGSILDINIRGCGCLLQALDAYDPLTWKIDEHVSLQCRFPGIEGEIEISGLIKNIRVTSEGTVIGIAFFRKMNPEVEEIITQYIISVGELD